MSTITFQFSTPHTKNPIDAAVSKSIRWKTDSEISHVDVVTPEGNLLGAHIHDGVQVRLPNYENFALRIRVTIPVTEDEYSAFFKYVKAQVGCKYDKEGIEGIAFGNNEHSDGQAFCSELQARGIQVAGIFRIAKEASKIDPETLRLLVSAVPGAVEQRIVG